MASLVPSGQFTFCASEISLLSPQTCERSGDPNEVQRSGFVWERRSKGAGRRFRRKAEAEQSGLCDDERCGGLLPFEKMLAFSRERVEFFDPLISLFLH